MDVNNEIRVGKFKEVANSVFIGDHIFSEKDCQEILDEFDNDEKWNAAKIGVVKQNESGKNDVIGVLDISERNASILRFENFDMSKKPKTLESLIKLQKQVSVFTTEEFGLEFNQFGNEQLIKYPEGGLFKEHIDVYNNNSHRAFTIILYLNDDFEGGETGFPNLNYKCKPKVGRALIFLSSELHSGLTVKKGEKKNIVFWGFFPGQSNSEEKKSDYFNPEIH